MVFWKTSAGFFNDQLAIQQTLWDLLSNHSKNNIESAKPALTEVKVNGGKTSTSQNFYVGDYLLPCSSKDAAKAS